MSKYVMFMLLCSIGLVSWQRPSPPFSDHPITEPHLQLDYMLLEINGDRYSVKNNGELSIVAGDRIRILEAVLMEQTVIPQIVNFVGYYGKGGTSAEDRNVEVNSDVDLVSAWAEVATDSSKAPGVNGFPANESEVFAITALSHGKFHGAVYVRVLKPKLKFVEVSVDGVTSILRNGYTLKLSRNNKLKIGEIKTNFSPRGDLAFFFKQVSQTKGELLIRRNELVFATIHLVIED